MPAVSDLVHETTTSTGTGNLTTASVSGKRSFNTAFGTGGTNVFDYFIAHQTAAEWEFGTGHLSAATTLVRDTVVASSNANAAVSFSAGTKDIANDLPSARQNMLVANNNMKHEQYSADATDNEILFQKSRNATVGSHTIVQSDDDAGTIRFQGSNGTTFDTAAFIQSDIDGTPGASADMPGRVGIWTTPDGSATPLERMRIDRSGRQIMGGVAAVTLQGDAPQFQLLGTVFPAAVFFAANFANTTTDLPGFLIGKSRGATIGAHTIVQNNDPVGAVGFWGSDGTDFREAVKIQAEIDAAPGASDMPGRLVFLTTPDGAAAATETFRIPSNKWIQSTDAGGNVSFMPRTYRLGAQHSVSSATATQVTGLVAATLPAGTYCFDYYLIVRSSTAADGLAFGISHTGTVTKIVSMLTWPDTGVTAALGAVDDVANATTGQVVAYSNARTTSTTTPNMSTGTTGVATTAVDLFVQIKGVIVTSTAGDLQLWHGSESTNATTVEIGSSLILHRTA